MSQEPQIVENLSPRTKWKYMVQDYNVHDAIWYLFHQFLCLSVGNFTLKDSSLLAHLNLIKILFSIKQFDRKILATVSVQLSDSRRF